MSPVVAPDTHTPVARLGYHDVPLTHLVPSTLNPRKRMTGLEELTASVRATGILEPLLVRPVDRSEIQDPVFEVVAGGRRLEAARAAGLVLVPCLVRALSDAQALEVAIVENNQRGDIHPIEEAEAFARLRTLDRAYTPEAIAAKIGRPIAYVKTRLRLLNLVKPAREAFAADQIALSHAQLLSKLTDEQQLAALDHCYEKAFDFETGKGQRIVGPAAVSQLVDWINDAVRLDPHATEAQEEFPELAADVARATAEGATVLMLADTWGPRGKDGDPLPRNFFNEAKKTTKGAVLGVFVQGRRRGKTAWVTVIKPVAPPPRSPTSKTSTRKTAAQRANDEKAKAAEARRLEAARAKRAREGVVLTRALTHLVDGVALDDLSTAPVLRLLSAGLAGADSYDRDVLHTIAKRIGVPPAVFDWNGAKQLLKLSPKQLAKVVAVQAVGADGAGVASPDAFDAFGVQVKAIDKAVQTEEAAAAKLAAKGRATPAGKTPPAKKAAKKR